jgi:hypothetical protein
VVSRRLLSGQEPFPHARQPRSIDDPLPVIGSTSDRSGAWHDGAVRRWELWSGADDDETTSDSFFREDNDKARQMAIAEGLTLVWSTFAEGHNDAMRTLHVYMGWEEYKPMLQPDGTPYPEGEADEGATE